MDGWIGRQTHSQMDDRRTVVLQLYHYRYKKTYSYAVTCVSHLITESLKPVSTYVVPVISRIKLWYCIIQAYVRLW